MIDFFIMETRPHNEYRDHIESVSNRWIRGMGFRPILITPREKIDPLQFQIDARQQVFTSGGSEIFVLSDNDMLPFDEEHIQIGIQQITDNVEFAIISAWPDPHRIMCIDLPGRDAIENESLLESYAVGGLRFCRKVPGLKSPQVLKKGYDGVFCRHLWSEHGLRVGYSKVSRAFHLGANCTTLWTEQSE